MLDLFDFLSCIALGLLITLFEFNGVNHLIVQRHSYFCSESELEIEVNVGGRMQ